jgi:hypothetical protein
LSEGKSQDERQTILAIMNNTRDSVSAKQLALPGIAGINRGKFGVNFPTEN